tara:strand:- start:126 stop:341 length:216 start_codon:yes stop_codon:yes gene_type:complete
MPNSLEMLAGDQIYFSHLNQKLATIMSVIFWHVCTTIRAFYHFFYWHFVIHCVFKIYANLTRLRPNFSAPI